MNQKCLILLIETLAFCKENNRSKIKRSDLLKLCNNKLNELSEGDRPKFGGSFEACLKKYSDPSILPNKRFLTVERSNVRHNTQIYPNIDLIEKHLQAEKILNVYTNPNTVTKAIHASLYERVQVSDTVAVRVTRANSKDFLRDINTGLCSFLKSDLIHIHLSAQKHDDTDLCISEHTERRLAALVEQLASSINKTKEEFIIMLEYHGIPTTLVSLAKSGKQGSFYKRLSTYFEEWLEFFQRDKLTKQEITSLRTGDLDSLGQDAKEKLRLFLTSIIDSSNSPLENDKLHLPIIEELYMVCQT